MKLSEVEMNGPDLRHLDFLSETDWGRSHLKNLLHRPLTNLWGTSNPQQFSENFQSIKLHLEEEQTLFSLMELHLITAALLQKDRLPEWFAPWLLDHIDVGGHLPGIEWHTFIGGRWEAVPVNLVHERAYLRYFLLGLLGTRNKEPLWPVWADAIMDQSAKAGVLSAAAACNSISPLESGRGFYVYPLTISNRNIQFTQGSLGLPLALGFLNLFTGREIFEDFAATGSVDKDGVVHQAAHLSLKIEHAGVNGFKMFLVPAANPVPSSPEGMEVLPVSNLREAWMFTELYTPGKKNELILMSAMLEDPRVFVNNCPEIPVEWLQWAHQNNRTNSVIDAIMISSEVFESFIDKLSSCLAKGDLARGEVLSKLINPEMVGKSADVAPLSVFKWFTLNLSIANHRGDINAAEMWRAKADRMVEKASVSDAEAFANFYNHRFVGLCHNRYHFDPDLPGYVKAILEALECQFRSQRKLVKNATNETLGALHGSIAQHYGFRGPEYLMETRRYSLLSREAFGDGRVPELMKDWLRQLNYLAYAEIDAGKLVDAENTLLAYMEIESWEELWPNMDRLSEWHHALLVRFFSDGKEREERHKYTDWALKNKNRILHRKHPWQLWLNNMGRASYKSGDTKNGVRYFNESLVLCLSDSLGPTVHVMALLPLAGLWHAGGLSESEMAAMAKKIRRSAEGLNPDYFRPLLDEPEFSITLEKIWNEPEALFPFTYR